MLHDHDTIVAPATPTGGAIAVVRVSGSGAIETVERIFRGRRPLSEAAGYTLHRGTISDGARLIDDVLVSLFRAPHSYTGEDSVEISCHGSAYVVSEILRLLLDAGARMATPGEFTLRAFLAAHPGAFDQVAFVCFDQRTKDAYDRATRTRTILKIAKVYDVSAVSAPANPATEISARSYFDGVIERERQDSEQLRS